MVSCQKTSFDKTNDRNLIGKISDCEYDKKEASKKLYLNLDYAIGFNKLVKVFEFS